MAIWGERQGQWTQREVWVGGENREMNAGNENKEVCAGK